MHVGVFDCVCEDTGKGKCSLAAKPDLRIKHSFLFGRVATTVQWR